ncbi:Gfo/Idh/MocA family protein [Alkalicoccus daliensis]|uniref:Predicted dehydrogenase n=1 Tax=Alkalicoccus daliensis TaxID=745820 RepID=A0A1H0DQP5_9BACI|nr:Gfo/Idh/MocA family oxidoreductase [Alkalicoccus daliensis]SDN72472.1 Predicted dehydrogenase [Alkalicoccus daliensis]
MNIATIGTGFIVERFLKAAALTDNVTITAMYSRKHENARPLAETFNIPSIFTSLEEMLTDPSIDAVYIASPNSMHFLHTEKALLAGKHVLCEKPFASNQSEAEKMIRLAEENELILMEAITTIHLPNFLELSPLLKEVGPIRLVKCSYSQYSSRYDKLLNGETTNVFNTEFSGGALMDINVYNLHFVIRLFGAPESVTYHANKHENGIDTSGIALLSYPSFQAECTGSKDTAGFNAAFIQGEKGWIHVIDGVNGCRRIELHAKDTNKTVEVNREENLMYEELLVFKKLVTDHNLSAAMELLSHSRKVMKVLDQARKSADIRFPADKLNGSL